jgi:hypothetical protein
MRANYRRAASQQPRQKRRAMERRRAGLVLSGGNVEREVYARACWPGSHSHRRAIGAPANGLVNKSDGRR